MLSLLFWIGIGSAAFHLISGLRLYSNDTIQQTSGFTLICDVEGGAIVTSIAINDPSGTAAASCFQPPAGCGSGVGNTFYRDIAGGTFTVNVLPSNIHVTNSVGSWSCTDGSNVASFPIGRIASFTEAKVWDVELTVNVKIDCIYPYPDEVRMEYRKKSDQSTVKIKTDVAFVNGTASNCPVVEARAISMEGTFTRSNIVLDVATEIEIVAVVYLNGTKLGDGGPSNFTFMSATTNGKGSLFLHAFLPVFLIVLIGINIFFGLTWCVCKDGPFKQGSMKRCCPSNIVCNVVCPMCTKPKAICSCCSGFSFIVQCAISVVVFLIVAAIIGVIIAFGLGLESGKDDLALGLSIVFGVVLVVIYIISVYPLLAYAPNEREDDSTEPDNPDVIIKPAENPDVITTPEEGTKSYINCFMPCRVNPSQDTIKTDENNSGKKNPKREPAENRASPNKETPRKTDENNSGKKNPKREPAENQASPNRETPRSPQASASGIQLTTAEGRSPRPLVKLPAIVNESTLNTKEMGTPLPVPPISKKQLAPVQTIQTEDTRDEEETRKKRKKKKKNKKKEGEENGGDDKRDSQNSGGQANVEEEEQK